MVKRKFVIMSKLITLVTAQLAKEVGYEEPVFHYFQEPMGSTPFNDLVYTDLDDEEIETKKLSIDDLVPRNCNSWDDFPHKYYSRPTQSDLQEWIRSKSQLHIGIGISENGWIVQVYSIIGQTRKETMEFDNCKSDFESYEDALEEGLILALKVSL